MDNRNRNRNRNESDEMMGQVIEAMDEERVLEYIIAGMSTEERSELASELLDGDPFKSTESSKAWAQVIIDQLDQLTERDSEKADWVKMNLIWQIAGGQDGN